MISFIWRGWLGDSGNLRNQLSTIRQIFSTIEKQIMASLIHKLSIESDRDDGLIVTFSDGMTYAYVVEGLLALRPIRERIKN